MVIVIFILEVPALHRTLLVPLWTGGWGDRNMRGYGGGWGDRTVRGYGGG